MVDERPMVASASQPTTTVTMAAVFDLEAPEPEVFDLGDDWGADLDLAVPQERKQHLCLSRLLEASAPMRR